MIEMTAIITEWDLKKFHNEMTKQIKRMQDYDLTVEVQYQPFGNSHSVLLIGKRIN